MKERVKGAFTKKKIFHFLKMPLFVVALSLILLSLLGTVAHATGLVDDTINAENLYSKYPLSNYQLDFYVDNSWSWLPWNWLDGIGKSVQYGLYCITNFVWTISLYLSNATGYVVQEAYKLDFINDMADSIGKSIQTLAGVTQNGFSSTGFYIGFLLLIILVVGLYVAYTGLIKRETSKALHAVINFVVVFVLSASFIAYAPDYIKKINEFSSDISTASLDLGTKIMLPNSDSEGKDSVDLIRDSLFSIQVEQPWLLLQFGNSNAEEIGTDRVEALVSASPEDEDGKTREEVVKIEIEDNDNSNLTIPQVVNRLGMVFFLLFFNLGITIFVFLLTGMMLFSQILFIIFAMFLPISFLLSMIPSYESMAKQAIVRVFNTIMTRAGITLIVTVAFSISSMFYNISADYPFFMVAFLQIVCFAGIYMKLGDLMSMFSLNAGDSQSMGRRIFRRPYLFMRHRARRMERRLAGAVTAGGVAGAVAGSTISNRKPTRNTATKDSRGNTTSSMGQRAGSKVGAVLDTKNKVKDKANAVKENIKDMPTQTAYAVYSAKEKAKSSVSDFKRGMVQEQQSRQTGRLEKQEQHRQNIADKRMELQKAQEARQAQRKADGSATTGATRPHERPATASKPSAEKMQEVKRPATAPTPKASEPVKTNVVKERPLSFGASDKQATQSAQPVHRQNVEKVVSQETRQNYTKDRRIKVQQTQTVQKNQQTTEKNLLWSSIFVTLMANKIGGLQFGIYRNCQISSRVFHTAVAALPLTKANRSDFE
ncbi:CD3337/EF1877 family mobilome membrane protein [Mediterraneibacter gnavus]|uniref:CD3337/EF1877 family mobilome membrane protein n=1 Tax=Mediterraneibacter gnavus TaxID=33038 RepID=UPI00366AEADD